MNHFAADVLNVNSPMALITPDMLNMDLIQEARENTKAKIIKGHPLAPSLAPHFWPSYHAYGRLHTSILQCFAVLHNQPRQSLLDNIPNDVSSVHAVHTHFQVTFENLGSNDSSNSSSDTGPGVIQLLQHFCGAMAALAFLSSTQSKAPALRQGKTNSLHSKNRALQFHMLSGLLVFGPTSIFSSHHTGPGVSISNSRGLLEMGVRLLEEKKRLNPGYKLPESPFDTMRLYFLNFLLRMGFHNLNPATSIPMVNWKDVLTQFHSDFSIEKLTRLFSTDIEIIFSNMPDLPFAH